MLTKRRNTLRLGVFVLVFLIEHIRRHAAAYVLVIVCFFTGLAVGATSINSLPDAVRLDLARYVHLFFQGLEAGESIHIRTLLQESLMTELRLTLILWLLGATVIGLPVVLLVLFLQGFTMGFTVAFLVYQSGWSGLFFVLLSVLPKNIFAIPALLFMGAAAAGFSLHLIGNRLFRRDAPFFEAFLRYSITVGGASLFLFFAAVLEALITPSFMRLFANRF